jgi:hypothetical protein
MPPSYEHAHSATSTQFAALLPSKHTVPDLGASPTDGCGVLSHPVYLVPHREIPGGELAMRKPASPPKRYQSAVDTSSWVDIGLPAGCPSHHVPPRDVASLRLASSSAIDASTVAGQSAWQSPGGELGGGGEGAGAAGGPTNARSRAVVVEKPIERPGTKYQ